MDSLVTKWLKDTTEKRLQLIVIPEAFEQRKHNGQQRDDGEKRGVNQCRCPDHQAVVLKPLDNMDDELCLFY